MAQQPSEPRTQCTQSNIIKHQGCPALWETSTVAMCCRQLIVLPCSGLKMKMTAIGDIQPPHYTRLQVRSPRSLCATDFCLQSRLCPLPAAKHLP